MISYQDIKHNPSINTYIKMADESLAAQGFTEHSFPHVNLVSKRVEYILKTVGASAHEVELGRIAAYLHDIGNLVNREEHSQSGAVMAFRILLAMGMNAEDVATVVTAIGNHDEGNGVPVNNIAAALIIADKSDVRRSRVRNTDIPSFDIHDRVNYSVNETALEIDREKTDITLKMDIETEFSSVMDYFEIFLQRMVLCRKAAAKLGLKFKLQINGQFLM
ncbi:MAG: HD domain-containing protein [Ruminococcaceae bacterium]|nr:HD domain-containing protein [Oscillospiraceae bacterium]